VVRKTLASCARNLQIKLLGPVHVHSQLRACPCGSTVNSDGPYDFFDFFATASRWFNRSTCRSRTRRCLYARTLYTTQTVACVFAVSFQLPGIASSVPGSGQSAGLTVSPVLSSDRLPTWHGKDST
jgi:hypothetical protein